MGLCTDDSLISSTDEPSTVRSESDKIAVFKVYRNSTLNDYRKHTEKFIACVKDAESKVKEKDQEAKAIIEADKVNMAMFKHKNIVGYLGWEVGPMCKYGTNIVIPGSEDAIAIYMEYMAGGSLADILNLRNAHGLGGVPESQIKMWLRQILTGLQYLHSNNMLHRDIKSENVLLDADMQTLKLADFGTASL